MTKSNRKDVRADVVAALALLLSGFVLLASGRGFIRHWQESAARRESLSIEDLLGAAAALSGAVLLAWWLLSAVAAGTAVLLERRGKIRAASMAWRVSPAFMRRLVIAAVSVQLVSGAAANAATPVVPGPQWAPTQESTSSAKAPDGHPTSLTETSAGLTETSAGDAAAITGQSSMSVATSPAPQELMLSPASGAGPAESPVPGSATAVGALTTEAEVPASAEPTPLQPAWRPSAPVVEPGFLASPDSRGGSLAGDGDAQPHGPVAVLAGDTLWDIVAEHLGTGATDVQVALEWPRWYAANRAVIGQDPDVLLPGQVLQPPSQQ